MDELSQAVAPFLPSSSSAGGLNQPPAPSGDSVFFPISQSDEGEEQPAGTSEIEKAKAKRESLNRFPKPHPPNIAFENALIRQDHIMEKMANILKDQGIHLEDPLDIKRGVDLFLHDIMQMESRTRSTQLRKILTREVRIRSVRILIGLGLTWFTRYWFPEELISPLAKPFLTLPFDSYFVRTQSTEAFPTYVATSSIACSYFVFPLISHQIWCFLIPSCYGEQRRKYNRFLHLSGSRFSLFLFLTLPRVVPNVWHFPYFMGETSTNSLMIKLQPKIYDHIMLTVRISFIPSVCSQVPVIVIRLLEPRGLSVETSTNNRRFLMVFPLLTAALSTPPDIWCQIFARFLISLIIELAIFVASIVQVREEGWTSGMRESGSIDKKEE
ncbi:hypothetical protein DH2020_048802 [Rehmannia glutinosa]|uniref:Transport membrane protein n=1 Tax=Rehmannia glutinosa TaxID=99300 RepID=A0ABR0U5T4_REHGL